MAKNQVPNTSGEEKYDAFPYRESPCVAFKTDLSDIIKTNGFYVASQNTHSDPNQEADKGENFYSLLSDIRKDNQPTPISPCKLDFNLSDVSVPKALERDPKLTDFLDFTCPNSATKSMKFKDISECEGNGFPSDMLSPVTNNSSSHNSICAFADDFNLSDICVPKLHGIDTKTSSNEKDISSNNSAFDLSDILSSLSVDNEKKSKSSNSKKSSVENCEKTLSFDDFKISNEVSHVEKNTSSETNQENLSDILSSLDILNVSSKKCIASKKNNPSFNMKSVSLSSKTSNDEFDEGFCGFKSCEPKQEQVNFDDFNFGEFGYGSEKEEKQSMDFPSFDISKKDTPFSLALDKDEVPKRERYSSSEDSGISLMDFLSSVENSKEKTSDDDSDKFSSPSVSTPEEEIDLNICIKTIVEKSIDESSPTKDNSGMEQNMFESTDPGSHIHPLPLQHSIAPVTSPKRKISSLIAESLSCEGKKDLSLIEKVSKIRADAVTLNRAFGRSTPVNFHLKKPLPNVATYSDIPAISYPGRRMFGSKGASIVC